VAFETKQTGETAVVRLQGECTVEHATHFYSALVNALGSADRVVLNFEGVTAVDVSCLQLICSAHRTVLGSEKHLSFDANQPEVFTKKVLEAGYYRTVGCHNDPLKECLWRRELKR
jgi:anti-anti-sigma factor